MQVTHIHNSENHAVVGGSDVKSFGLSDNAEFITMLSEGLYSDKYMAVIREVLCNANDAHINADVKEAIRISIKDSRLSIRDFGKGINDAVIGPIYCVYGNSTKKNSKSETGGFGLGSKAPFAYTQHFKVISNHNGTKTVYAVSRGSVETDGKPDMRTIVASPTDETGLEVSFNVENSADERQFIELVKTITFFGDMNVELNGEILPTIGESDRGVYLIKNDYTPQIDSYDNLRRINVIYGSVVYPITQHDDYDVEYQNLFNHIFASSTHSYNDDMTVFLEAEPDSLSVVPSREALSMTPQTRQSIKKLLLDKYEQLNTDMLSDFANLFDKVMQKSMKSEKYINRLNFLHNLNINFLINPNQFLEQEPDINVNQKAIIYRDMTRVFKSAGSLKTLIVIIDTMQKHDPSNTFVYRNMRKLIKAKFFSDRRYNAYKMRSSVLMSSLQILRLKNYLPKKEYNRLRIETSGKNKKFTDYAESVLQNETFGVLDISKAIVSSSFYAAEKAYIDLTKECSIRTFIDFRSTKRKGHKEELLELANGFGFSEVMDVTDVVAPKADKVVDDTPRTTRPKKGYTLLSSLLRENSFNHNGRGLMHVDNKVSEDPKVVTHLVKDSWHSYIYHQQPSLLKATLALYPDTTVVVSSDKTERSVMTRYKDCFTPDVKLWQDIKHEFDNSPEFAQSLTVSYYLSQEKHSHFLSIAAMDAVTRVALGLKNKKTTEKQSILSDVFSSFYVPNATRYGSVLSHVVSREVREFCEANMAKPPKQTKKFIENPLLKIFDFDSIVNLLSQDPKISKKLTKDVLATLQLTY